MDYSNTMDALVRLKSGLLAKATDGQYADKDYRQDIQIVQGESRLSKMLPAFVTANRTMDDFRRAMQAEFDRYADRRKHIDQGLAPAFEYLDNIISGADKFIGNTDAYELGKPIGDGGFGIVYKYYHKLLDMDFAIKVFEPVFVSSEENIEGEKRFFREAKILFKMNDSNIIRVFDIGRTNGKPFIRMEYIDGDTIQTFIDKNGAVSFERSKKPINALLLGLNYAHKMGVIHRDLKPTNFMVTTDGKFKIIDFGISAYLENTNHSKLTKTGESVAGGLYTDPVLIANPSLRDVRSDIYSVGAIWYYLLVGRASAGGDARKNLLLTGNATELQCDIIYKCLSSDPKDRYQSCEEILNIINPPPKTLVQAKNSVLPNRITELTREYIFDYLLDRFNEERNLYIYNLPTNLQEPERVFYYCGRRDDITFLNRLYDLKTMPTEYTGMTFEDEIHRHTIANNDFEYGWVFNDERLGLRSGDDEILLKFICEMFHPVVRSEKSDWEKVKDDMNELLKADGYEIYESEKISGRSVFSYRFSI